MRTQWIVPSRPTAGVAPGFRFPTRNPAPFDRLLSDVWGGFESVPPGGFAPCVDIEERDDEVCVSAELPGLEEKDFEVTLEDDVLSIKGEKRTESESESKGATRSERTSGSFERRFRLPFEADPATLTASFRNGLLTVIVPKPEEEEPRVRNIPITAN
jgi:HSP20 family protein